MLSLSLLSFEEDGSGAGVGSAGLAAFSSLFSTGSCIGISVLIFLGRMDMGFTTPIWLFVGTMVSNTDANFLSPAIGEAFWNMDATFASGLFMLGGEGAVFGRMSIGSGGWSGGRGGIVEAGKGGASESGGGGGLGESSGGVGESGLYLSPAATIGSSGFFSISALSQRRFFLYQQNKNDISQFVTLMNIHKVMFLPTITLSDTH